MNKRLLLAAGSFAMLAALLSGITQVHRAHADQDDEDEQSQQSVHRPSWLSVQNGETVVTLDVATRSQAQIAVGSLEAVSGRQEVTAPAVVLSAQDLVSLRNAALAAQTRIAKAQASLAVSRQEYERLRKLYQDNQNASEKALQAAEGTFLSDQAEAQAAYQERELQAATAQQGWGNVVADWVRDGSPFLQPIFNQSELLVQVTIPPDEASTAPHKIALDPPSGKRLQATLVSAYPHVDPRVQGPSFLYDVPAHPGLAPGVNLVARIAVGPAARGVLVPESAVVWWQGRAWIYRQIGPSRYTRRAVSTETPLPNGYFVAKGFSPGDQVVLKGADWLLSEEFRYQAQPEGED